MGEDGEWPVNKDGRIRSTKGRGRDERDRSRIRRARSKEERSGG